MHIVLQAQAEAAFANYASGGHGLSTTPTRACNARPSPRPALLASPGNFSKAKRGTLVTT